MYYVNIIIKFNVSYGNTHVCLCTFVHICVYVASTIDIDTSSGICISDTGVNIGHDGSTRASGCGGLRVDFVRQQMGGKWKKEATCSCSVAGRCCSCS